VPGGPGLLASRACYERAGFSPDASELRIQTQAPQ